jgi:hypothetical protein
VEEANCVFKKEGVTHFAGIAHGVANYAGAYGVTIDADDHGVVGVSTYMNDYNCGNVRQ